MSHRSFASVLALSSALALAVLPGESSAAGGVAARTGGAAPFRPNAMPVARGPAFRHHRHVGTGIGPGFVWPVESYSAAPYGGPEAAAPTASGPVEVRRTQTYDVPWDWAHRFPPNVVPSDRPYVPSCPTERVEVPGRGGVPHVVNVTRCY